LHRHQIAGRDPVNVPANRQDLSGKLVTENARHGLTGERVRFGAGDERSFEVFVHICAAQAVEEHPEQHVLGAVRRLRDVVITDVLIAVIAQRKHDYPPSSSADEISRSPRIS
jgi:hypothetical protein